MYCPHCGSSNLENATQCAVCGRGLAVATPGMTAPQQQQQPFGVYVNPAAPSAPPASVLGWSIATALCCCPPLGVVSIVFAARVSSLWNAGDYAGALDAHAKARTWAWVAFGLGLLINVLWVLLQVAVAVLSASTK